MDIVVHVREGKSEELLRRVAERMGCEDNYETVLLRSLSLAATVTWHLQEEGAKIEFLSPRDGPSELAPGPLYGRGGGINIDDLGEM